MGFTLEYNRVFYHHNDSLIFVNRLGDSNVIGHDGLRSRDWHIISIGPEEKIWELIGERIGSVAGGMLQRAVGWSDSRYFTPLEYVKMYRSKIKNARPLEQMFDDFSLMYNIRIKTSKMSKDWQEGLIRLGVSYENKEDLSEFGSISTAEQMETIMQFFPSHLYSLEHHLYFTLNNRKRRI